MRTGQDGGSEADALRAHVFVERHDFGGYSFGERRIVGDEIDGGILAVLGLVEHVQRHLAHVRRSVGQHDRFAGARRGARVDPARQQALGRHEPGAAGAHDLVAARNRLRSVGGCRHSLGTTGLVDRGNVRQRAGI